MWYFTLPLSAPGMAQLQGQNELNEPQNKPVWAAGLHPGSSREKPLLAETAQSLCGVGPTIGLNTGGTG